MTFEPQNTSLVCNMNVFTPAKRKSHIHTTTQLFHSVQNIQEVENGFEFIFPNPNNSEILTRMTEFITNERLCCPFLKFTLTINPNPQPVSLLLTGPEGTQEFLRAEFSEAFA